MGPGKYNTAIHRSTTSFKKKKVDWDILLQKHLKEITRMTFFRQPNIIAKKAVLLFKVSNVAVQTAIFNFGGCHPLT